MERVRVIILSSMLLGSWLLGISNTHAGEYDQGKALYDSKCLICHGAKGKGDGPAAAALSTQPRDFTRTDFWQGDVEKEIAETIRKGLSPMPAFDLSDDEIKAITGYMSHAFK